MKASLSILIFLFFLMAGTVFAQDSVYVMQKGVVKYRRALSDIDSVSFVNVFDIRNSIVENIAKRPNFSLFYDALVKTGLADSLRSDKDRSYLYSNLNQQLLISKVQGYWYYQEYPISRRYGFTVFLESNATFQDYGINNFEDLRAFAKKVYDQVYPEDAGIDDVTDRRNSLNRFIAYHLINKRLSARMLIDAYDTDHMLKTVDMTEYLETMCPNTLMEVSKIRSTGKTNQLNRSSSTGQAVQILSSAEIDPKCNGVFHEVDRLLVYSNDVINELSNKRLRFDFASLFPEMTNNVLRGKGLTDPNLRFLIPSGYIQRIKMSTNTTLTYLTANSKLENYEGDELSVSSSNESTPYDFSITLPPIPSGTYEVRLGYIATGNRGVASIEFDNQNSVLPIDFNMIGLNDAVGYVKPNTQANDLNGYENDKVLRNHGYMKGPASFKVITSGFFPLTENARFESTSLRKIVGTFTFNRAINHSIAIKGLVSGIFQLDYIEFIPVSLLETEDIY